MWFLLANFGLIFLTRSGDAAHKWQSTKNIALITFGLPLLFISYWFILGGSACYTAYQVQTGNFHFLFENGIILVTTVYLFFRIKKCLTPHAKQIIRCSNGSWGTGGYNESYSFRKAFIAFVMAGLGCYLLFTHAKEYAGGGPGCWEPKPLSAIVREASSQPTKITE